MLCHDVVFALSAGRDDVALAGKFVRDAFDAFGETKGRGAVDFFVSASGVGRLGRVGFL